MTRYAVTLDGKPLASGTLQEAQQACMETVTGFLAQDPEGVAPSAHHVNRYFQEGHVELLVLHWGAWEHTLHVHGQAHTLRVAEEENW